MSMIHGREFHRSMGALWTLALPAALACGGDDVQSPPADVGEPVVAGCQDATLSATSALYRVCFPPSWNGDLVVYAHGYVNADEPVAIPDDGVGGQSVAQIVNGLGYAYATTSYLSLIHI